MEKGGRPSLEGVVFCFLCIKENALRYKGIYGECGAYWRHKSAITPLGVFTLLSACAPVGVDKHYKVLLHHKV